MLDKFKVVSFTYRTPAHSAHFSLQSSHWGSCM